MISIAASSPAPRSFELGGSTRAARFWACAAFQNASTRGSRESYESIAPAWRYSGESVYSGKCQCQWQWSRVCSGLHPGSPTTTRQAVIIDTSDFNSQRWHPEAVFSFAVTQRRSLRNSAAATATTMVTTGKQQGRALKNPGQGQTISFPLPWLLHGAHHEHVSKANSQPCASILHMAYERAA